MINDNGMCDCCREKFKAQKLKTLEALLLSEQAKNLSGSQEELTKLILKEFDELVDFEDFLNDGWEEDLLSLSFQSNKSN